MALVVHEAFPFEGKEYRRGDVLFGAAADRVAANTQLARRCSAVRDDVFATPPPPQKPSTVAVAPASASNSEN